MKLIVLIAPSSAGKDYILNKVLNKIKEIKPIISYTTRPMRDMENGTEYNFVTKEKFYEMVLENKFIEVRSYNVSNGDIWFYGLPKDELDLKSNYNYITILDFEGYKVVKKYLEDLGQSDKLTSIYIDTNSKLRLLRSLSRENDITDEKVREIIRRFLADYNEVECAKDYVDYVMKNNNDTEAEAIILKIMEIIKKNN